MRSLAATWALTLMTGLGLVLGVAARVAGWSPLDDAALASATGIALVTAVGATLASLRRREPGVDLIAVLAMGGALALGELVAGAVIAVMLTGGQALERFAEGRARRELSALLSRAPNTAHRLDDEGLTDIGVDAVEPGDRLVVRTGEVLPTDAVLTSPDAVLDESALTGESRPVEAVSGRLLRSGAVNVGPALEMRATTTAARSTYAGVIRLVEQAATERSPFVRMADRYAAWFVPLTALLAGGAWAATGDPIRGLAVLVVATPCPLILAAPAAIVGGLSAAARRGIIVKGGGALESLASADTVLLDKTGTITTGRPEVTRLQALAPTTAGELLRAVGALEQLSLHPFAPAIVAEAAAVEGPLPFPTDVVETLGGGIQGRVDEREVRIGRRSFVTAGGPLPPELRGIRRMSRLEGSTVVYASLDGRLAGIVALRDPLRPEAPRALARLRELGIGRVVMVTGDHLDVAQLVGDTVGVDEVLAERTPVEKVDAVRDARTRGRVVMAGDGVNDSPALALADVGVAMGAHGATAASEAADVVLTVDRLGALADAVGVAQRTRRIARQSALAGMGMSAVAMVVASVGLLTPVAGALLQEAIDLTVILNALRAVSAGRADRRRASPPVASSRLLAEHARHRRHLDEIDALAGDLEALPTATAYRRLIGVRDYLRDDLLPHELQEERELYPSVAAATPGEDPTAPLARTHREIARHVRLLERLLDELPAEDGDPDELLDARRVLWRLHGILALHFTLEDELYAELGGPAPQWQARPLVEP